MFVAAGALAIGLVAAWHYTAIDLALSHYDARAHLVVARRVFDSLMPGWQQIGGVWLPLPHVLNMLPVQVDAWYRTGASGIAISVLSMAVGVWALATLIQRVTGSLAAGVAGGALLMANPNLLYLQSTPMTEPVLFGATLLALALTARWLDDGATNARAPGLALAAACMTRYEAWPVTAAVVALACAVLIRRNAGMVGAIRACARLAAYPAIAIALFAANSRWTTGAWVVTGGFFVAENEALGRPAVAWEQIREGVYLLSGTATVWAAYAGAAALAVAFFLSRRRAVLVLAIAPAASLVLPLYAYAEGHPFRIRYGAPLVVACVVIAAAAIALLPRRVRAGAAAAAVIAALAQQAPFDRSAPLIVEAQRDAANQRGRARVTRYLEQHYDGRIVMMSMGSLAHYMHDLSHAGFRIREFLHEGNGEIWEFAFRLGPRGLAGWVAVEERAEGGDALFHRAQQNPAWLQGFERVAEGGGVALYRTVAR